MSGSGISWAICKSARLSRHITTPAPHHSVFCRPDALPAAKPTALKLYTTRALTLTPARCPATVTNCRQCGINYFSGRWFSPVWLENAVFAVTFEPLNGDHHTVASPGFDTRRGTKRRGYNLSHICKITQNMATPSYKRIRYPIHFFSNKMKNKLILITVVRKILNTFDMRDCLPTF